MANPGDKETDIGGMTDVPVRISTNGRRNKIVDEKIKAAEFENLNSDPPSGCYKITNIWRNAAGNIEYEWENIPVP